MTQKSFIIGIMGGSGCGKSTLSYSLQENYPDLIEVIHFDDYQKEEEEISFYKGMRNWDHPDAIDFDKLIEDLIALSQGQSVKIMTKSGILNPEYEEKGRISHTLIPRKVLIVEGYLAFHDPRIMDQYDLKVFLDLPIEESLKRRSKITYNDESEYNREILIPMHNKYIVPKKDSADILIDTFNNDQEEVYKRVENRLTELKVLNP